MLFPWDTIASTIDGVVDLPTLLASAFVALLIAALTPRAMRAVAIWIAQYAAVLGVVLTTAVAGRTGYVVGSGMGVANKLNDIGQLYYSIGGAAIAGIAGFAISALALSIFFVLFAIAENTKPVNFGGHDGLGEAAPEVPPQPMPPVQPPASHPDV